MQVGDSYTWTPMAFEGEASGERDKRLRRGAPSPAGLSTYTPSAAISWRRQRWETP